MCGVTGVLAARLPVADALGRMNDALHHRGPDDGDLWLDPAAGIALGHRRLAILELSAAGRQPMHSPCGRYVLVFNGEIYNHLELRKQLEASGVPVCWRGHSDTESLLACFAAWGMRATLERTVGMFALALWDRRQRRLHLARDRFGEKPLYYGWAGKAFVFGSELKALRRHPGFDNPIDRDVLALYLRFCYVPAPYSIYRGVYKLEPGCLLSLSLVDASNPAAEALFAPARHGGLVIERFWSLAEAARRGVADPISDDVQAVEELESALRTAVRLQSVADVPLGAFLSGGVDSSTIVALMQAGTSRPTRTFTIGLESADLNEAEHAQAVATYLGTDHTELYLSAGQARDVIPLLPGLYSEPFADCSQIPTFLVSHLARQHVTVALSGDAGDELFCGYNRYFWGRRIWKWFNWLPFPARRSLGQAMHLLPAESWGGILGALPGLSRMGRLGDKAQRLAHRLRHVRNPDDLYRTLVTEWSHESRIVTRGRELPTLLDEPSAVRGVADPEHRMMIWDTLTYLPDDILQKVDRASMGVSLETRIPFLDHRVAELCWRMPLNMKLRDGQSKWALRQVLYRHVPRELIERPKAGFGIPLKEWLRGPLREWGEELLGERELKESGLLDVEGVRESWQQHLSGTHDWTLRLWSVLMFQSWLAANE